MAVDIDDDGVYYPNNLDRIDVVQTVVRIRESRSIGSEEEEYEVCLYLIALSVFWLLDIENWRI